MSWFATACEYLCTYEDRSLEAVGMNAEFVHYVIFGATMGTTTLFLTLWMNAFPRLRRHGFGKLVWNLVFWFVLLMGFFQVAQFMAPYLGAQPIPCPYSSLVPAALAAVFCAIAYTVHLWKGNKGSLSEFFVFVASPAIGETVAASKTVAAFVVKVFHLFSM